MQNEIAQSTILLNGEQAKSELITLEAKASELRKTIKEATKVGDVDGLKKYRKELSEVQRQMRSVKSESFDAKKVLDNISGSSLKDLYAAQKKIDSLLKNGTVKRHSKEWTDLANSQKLIRKEINAVNKEMNVGETNMSKWANGFNKFFTMGTAVLASLTGAVLGIKQIISSNAELSDSFADVAKTTGLTAKEVAKLYDDFKSFNTRTPRAELLKLASDAGKLGIVGSKNILDFVDAGNQINVALGEDLGEDAIKNIGKMVGVFDKSTKELQALGLKEKMLAVGSAVNSIGQSSSASEEYLVAFAGRLGGISKQAGIGIDDILGYASALDQDMQQVEMSATALQNFIMKIMAEPAKFAKIAGISVKEFSTLLQTDANQAIKTVLKALNEKGGFQAMIPIFQDMGLDGSRAVGVLSSLAGSMDKVEEAQATANQSMIEGISITKEYDIRNNNLAASLSKLNQNISSWFKNSSITSFLSSMVSGLELMTRKTKTASEEFKDQSKKVINLKTNIEPLLTRYDELASKSSRSAKENGELKRIIKEVTSVMPGAVSAVDQYGNAISISTGRVREFINAEVQRYKAVNKDAIEENKKLLDKTIKELAVFKKRIDQINKTGTYEIPQQYGDYTKNLATAEQVANAQARYTELINLKAGYAAEIQRLDGTTIESELNALKKEQEILDKKAQEERRFYLMSKQELQKYVAKNNELAKKVYEDRFPKNAFVPGETESEKDKRYDKELKKLEQFRNDEDLINKKAYVDGTFNEEVYQEWMYQSKLDFLNEKLKLDKKFGKDTTATEVEIADTIIANNEYWQNKLLSEAEKATNDADKENKKKEKDTKEHLQKIDQIRNEFGLNQLKLTYAQELELLKEKLRQEEASEEETARAIADFKKRAAQDYLNDSLDIANTLSSALSNVIEAETIAVDNKYAKQLEAAKKAGKDTTELESKIEEEKKQIKKKYADLDFAITTAKIVSETALAIMEASPNVALQITTGLLGASQLALAVEQRNQVKNLWTGGWTGSGGKYDPKGVVHANEFVANMDSTSNSTLRKIFNLVDYAQKTNSVARIDNDTISRALSIQPGYSNGGFVGNASVASSAPIAMQPNSGDIIMMMIALQKTIDRLNLILEDGIEANSTISGKKGLYEQVEKYEQLLKNISRS